ncbi:hypothetical protein [Neptuniibacter sp.]|uniref:hypothetical protein n=1 Tax=Neptuniibacter sp. TaxID=1962643 RepID=UPI00262659C2|nr:hypothetical protein [Neptuniibacter sp.]MCP4597045.1 hypothetical protein [Neptuniibacter sp.]
MGTRENIIAGANMYFRAQGVKQDKANAMLNQILRQQGLDLQQEGVNAQKEKLLRTPTREEKLTDAAALADYKESLRRGGQPFEPWKLPDGTVQNIQRGQRPPKGAVPIKQKGIQLGFDADGKIKNLSIGGSSMGGMEKKVKGAIETKLYAVKEQRSRVGEIMGNYKREWLEWPTRLGGSWDSVKEKMGKKLPKEKVERLSKMQTFRSSAAENLNLYVKEITGAQMSNVEVKRLRLVPPDAGDGIFDGDSPTQFEAKADRITLAGRAAEARFTYYLKKGLEPEDIVRLINSNQAIKLEEIMEYIK